MDNQTDLKALPISELAHLIQRDWKNVYFGAVPYLEALHSLNDIGDMYFYESGDMIVSYFLSNAATWRGPVAKQIKAELNRRLKANRAKR